MSLQCAERAKHPSDIYTLSIPTGGGKTLASLRYALEHALYYGKRKLFMLCHTQQLSNKMQLN